MDEMIDIEEAGGDQLVALARLLRPATAGDFTTGHPPAPQRRRRIIPVVRSQARTAGGTDNDLVNVKIMRETAGALVGPDIPETEAAAEAVALLTQLTPRDAREALAIRRMIALDQLCVETVALAKESTGLLRCAYSAQATALSRAAMELDEAIERRRGGGQRVVEVKHVVVHNGGQAIVGPVTAIAPKPPSPPR